MNHRSATTKRGRMAIVALLGTLSAATWVAYTLLSRHSTTPDDKTQPDIAAIVAAIDASSRGDLPVAVSGPALPADASTEAAAATWPAADRPAAPPDGYAFVTADAEMARLPMPDGAAIEPEAADAGADWLDATDAIPALADQAAAAGRSWTFGWVRSAADAPSAAARASLEALGVKVLGVSGNLIRARLPGDATSLRAISALPEVAGLGAVPKDRKVAATFVEEVRSAPVGERTPVFVTLMTDDPNGRWRRALEESGAVVGRFDADIRVYAAHIAAGALDAIASRDFVLAVEPVGIARASHDTAVPAMGADALRRYAGSPGLFTGTTGASTAIAVMDTGLNINHLDIASNRLSICGANFVTTDARTENADLWLDQGGHGTHVTGTVVGNGMLEPRYAGMAPGVQHIRFAKVLSRRGWGGVTGVMRGMDFLARSSNCIEAGYDAAPVKPLIVNMSLSATSLGFEGRGTATRKLDATVWGHRQLYVVSQANSDRRGFSNYGTAKSALAVGAVRDSGGLAGFSSHGPTADGRLAPKVVATGVGINSARGQGRRGGYVSSNGTSMASPAVAGVAALLMDAAPEHKRQPALARARLMASAVKPDIWLDSPGGFPADNSLGPGWLHARYGLGKVSARTGVLVRDQAEGWTSGGAVVTMNATSTPYRDIEVPAGASRLDLVLTWDEPPTETVSQAVLNDLDLWLDFDADCGRAACGERWSSSRKDNVEWIIVRNPPAGTHRAKIVPRRIHGATPRAALAWTLIRGPATPTLLVQPSESELRGNGPHDLALTVTTNGYVAAGTKLRVVCEPRQACATNIRNASFVRADGVSLELANFGIFSPVSLGEVAVGEHREVNLTLANSGTAPLRVYFVATAWNAEPAMASVAIAGSGPAQSTVVDSPAPANDAFAAAAALEEKTGEQALDMLLATTEPGEPILVSDVSNRPYGSLWYVWTASEDGLARFHIRSEDGYGNDAYVNIFQGDSIVELERIGSQKPWGASFFATSGETYRVRVSHASRGSRLILHWGQGPRPPNDDFHAAAELTGEEGDFQGGNQGATLEPGEYVGSLAATTWHHWTAPADGVWNFSTEVLFIVLVFTGDAVADLRLISGGTANNAVFAAGAGERYRIAVAAPNAFAGGRAYRLTWGPTTRRAGNDDWANAKVFSGESSSLVVHSGWGSTVEIGEPEETGVRTNWWVWTAPKDGRYTWRATYNDHGLRLTALTSIAAMASSSLRSVDGEEARLQDLRVVGAIDPHSTSPEFSFDAVAGRRYWFSAGFLANDSAAFTYSAAGGTLTWGRTPDNDDRTNAALLAGPSGTTMASNRFATTERGERVGKTGHSSLWWAFEASAADAGGWQRFWTEGNSALAIAVYRDRGDGFGGLDLVATSDAGRLGVSEGSNEAIFQALPGARYLVRVGSRGEQAGDDFSLHWGPTEPPAWLKYAGRLTAAQLGLGRRSTGSIGGLAVDDLGTALYMQSGAGLHVLRRDSETGVPTPVRVIGNDFGGMPVIWDPHRASLLAMSPPCDTWHRFRPVGKDRLDLAVETLAGRTPQSCSSRSRLFIDPIGQFLYSFDLETDRVEIHSFDSSDTVRHVQTVTADGRTKDAVLSNDGTYLYVAGSATLRVFGLDATTSELTLKSTTNLGGTRALSITQDNRYLLALTEGGDTIPFGLESGPTRPRRLATLPAINVRWPNIAGECNLSAAHSGKPAIDVFCRNSAFTVARRSATRSNERREWVRADYLAHWQPDRFNNHIPKFIPLRISATSPDGRHIYVPTAANEILFFERVGNEDAMAPDLVVRPPTASDSNLAPGASFVLRATVRNQGDVEAPATMLRWYRSLDVRISSASDEEVATTSVAPLASSTSIDESATLTAPASAGTHYYGACVDAVPDESNTGNNCSASLLVMDGGPLDDHGNTPDAATDVAVPSTTRGELEEAGDRDVFRIVLQRAGTLRVATTGDTDTYGTLARQDGTAIGVNDDSGTGRNFHIERKLAAGIYFVTVRGYGADTTGRYVVAFELAA